MLTREPTKEMLEEWKKIYAQYRDILKPNRKNGREVEAYFTVRYEHKIADEQGLKDAVYQNIMGNKFLKDKLSPGKTPNIVTYNAKGAYIGIDRESGYFQVEREEIEKARPIYDDLFLYRGLDEQDLQNPFLVAEYIKLSRRNVDTGHKDGIKL